MKNIDRESERSLELLRFALEQQGIDEDYFCVGKLGDEKKLLFGGACLLDSDNGWIVLCTEKGQIYDRSTHESLDDAIKDFYGRLVKNPSPWDYIDEWEKETGKEF